MRKELEIITAKTEPPTEEWEFQLIRAILTEEHNCTVDEANAMNTRWPDSTPALDALNNCIRKARKPSSI